MTGKRWLGLAVALLLPALGAVPGHAAGTVADPMQPPEFALEKMRESKAKKAGVVRGPARPRDSASTKKAPMRLTSILIGPDRRVAIIDDKALTEGERIGSAKLVTILKDRVKLVRNGKLIELKLLRDTAEIRKTTTKSKL